VEDLVSLPDDRLHHYFGQYIDFILAEVRGPYNGRPLWRRNKAPVHRITRLRLAKSPREHISSNLNDIIIHTLNNNRIAPVLDSILQGFQKGDLLTAWYEGCAAADAVREDIIAGNPPPDVCQCSGEASLSTLHPCSDCLGLCLCSQQEPADDGTRKCMNCRNRQPGVKAAAELKTAADNAAIFWHNIKSNLTRALKSESVIKGIDWTDPSLTDLKDGHLALEKYWNISTQVWTNTYTQKPTDIRHTIDVARGIRQSYAFQASVDAVWPYGEFNKSYWTHCPSNLALTSLAMQFAKGPFVPAVLAHVSDYIRGSITADEVMQRMNDVYEIGMQSAYAKSVRLQEGFNKTKFAALQMEWLAGRLLTSRVSATSQKWQSNPTRAFKGWKPSCYERFIKIVREIEKKYMGGKKFPTGSEDDAPYPFHPQTVPKGELPMIIKLTLTNHFERLELAYVMESFRTASYEDEARLQQKVAYSR